MTRIFTALLLAGVVVYVVQWAVLLLLLAGLIFRTKETVGLIAILAMFALAEAYPIAVLSLLGIAGVVALYRFVNEPPDRRGPDLLT